MAVDVGSAVGYLDLDISGFIANLRNAENEANKRSKNIATTVANNLSSAGKKLSTAGTVLTATVTTPILGAGAAIVALSSNFESAMSKVSAISGATGSDLEKLNQKAQEMGAKTKFSATEAADAFTYMAMAGWKTEDMLQGIDGIMNLAAADGLDLATTSDIITDALTAFGLSASDSAHFADVLARASSSANTNVSMLGESFKYVAPVAGALGYSAEDTAIALGLMANAGIKGSQSGTALRSSISRLIKPTDDMVGIMEEYGLSLTNTDGSMKSLGEVMTMLRGKLGGLTEAEQAQAAATLFGQEAMSGMLAIINASDKDFENLTNQIYNADGAAQQMADTMLNNLKGQVTILKSSLEGLALQLGEILLPYIKQFVTWLQNLVQRFQALSKEQKEQIIKWAAIIAAIGPAVLIIGKFVSGIGSLITIVPKVMTGLTTLTLGIKNIGEGFTLAKAGFSGLAAEAGGFGTKIGVMAASVTGPMLAIAAVVAVLIAAFVNLWKNNEDFRNAIIAIWTQIKETFSTLIEGIRERLSVFEGAFSHVAEALSVVWNAFCALLAPLFEGAFRQVANAFETIVNIILGVLDVFIGFFTGNWKQMWNGILTILTSIGLFVVNTFKNIMNTLKGVLDTVCKAFGTTWNSTWTNIKSFFTNTLNSILSTTTNVLNRVKSAFSSALDSAKTIVKNGIDKIKSFFNFSWSLPKLKLPHFTISGKFSLNPPSVPTFGIDWYAKAMGNGMILNSPTIFGFDPKSGKFLGGGEAGSETVVGTSSLMSMIRHAVAEAIGPLVQVSRELTKASADLGYVAHSGFTKVKQIAEKYNGIKQTESKSGDTYNFYSPKAIDEIEAAKQMKKTKRELAEGF